MLLIFNKFKFYISNIKILLIFSNYNKNLSKIYLNNIYKKLIFIGIKKYNFIIISLFGSLEFYFILNILFKKNIFDLYFILGIIFKNQTFHFEVVSFNINFFILNLSFIFNIPLINSLIICNNKYLFLSKIIKLNNENSKTLIKFLNLINFLI